MKFSFILRIGMNEVITTGTLTRVYYRRVNKLMFLTKRILYNRMIVNGIFTILA